MDDPVRSSIHLANLLHSASSEFAVEHGEGFDADLLKENVDWCIRKVDNAPS